MGMLLAYLLDINKNIFKIRKKKRKRLTTNGGVGRGGACNIEKNCLKRYYYSNIYF